MIPYEITNLCKCLKNLNVKEAILLKDITTVDKRAYKIWEVILEDNSKEQIIQFKSIEPDSIGGEITTFLTPELSNLIDEDRIT